MFRKFKLKRLRKLRKVRDEILKEENEGRVNHLLFSMPGVRRVYTRSGLGRSNYCEVDFYDGFSFSKFGDSVIDAMKNVVTEVYLKCVKSI